MKPATLILALTVCFSVTAFAQPAGWDGLLDLGTLNIVSVTSSGYGQHLVGPLLGGPVKHYRYDNNGTQLTNNQVSATGDYPVITSYQGKLRITMKQGGAIKVYQSTDGGSTWPTIYTGPSGSIFNIDAFTDANGTHIVWETTNADCAGFKDIYYVRCDLTNGTFTTPKKVNDIGPVPAVAPKVTASSGQAHVVFRTAATGSLTSRDVVIVTGSADAWDNFYVYLAGGSPPINGWVSVATIGTNVYAVGFRDPLAADLVFTKRGVDQGNWDTATDIGNASAACPTAGPIKGLAVRNGKLYMASYETGTGVVLRSYTPGGSWSGADVVESVSGQDAASVKVSAHQQGVWVHYKKTAGNQYVRRKPLEITTMLTDRTLLTGNNWFSGSTAGVATGVSVDASWNVEILAGATFTNSGTYIQLAGTFLVDPGSIVVQAGSMTINSGAYLYAAQNSDFKFGSGKNLTVNGSLLAAGTSSNPVDFTSSSASPAPSDWYGIKLMGSSENILNYCRISYAQYGIYNNTSNKTEVYDGEISHCYRGIYSFYASAIYSLLVYGTKIHDNTDIGVLMISAYATFQKSPNSPYEEVEIYNNGHDGFSINTNSTLYIIDTRVENNDGAGVRMTGSGSVAHFGPGGAAPGNNFIIGNEESQVYKNLNPYVLIGDRFQSGGNWFEHNGYNHINGLYGFGGVYWVRNNTSTAILADLTYWGAGTCPPDLPPAAFFGPILTESPLCSGGMIPAALSIGGTPPPASLEASGTAGSEQHKRYGDYQLAQLANDPESATDAIPYLSTLVGPRGRQQDLMKGGWEEFLLGIETGSPSYDRREQAFTYRVQAIIDQARYEEAISLLQSKLSETQDEEFWWFCQTQLALASMGMKDFTSAERVLNAAKPRVTAEMAEEFNQLAFALRVASDGERNVNSLPSSGSGDDDQVTGTPDRITLHQNYPNPFNPTTTIQYELPSAADVQLVVYNVVGEEVATLLDGHQEAGFHAVDFDASGYPSGVYFYRLKAGSTLVSKKMFLLK